MILDNHIVLAEFHRDSLCFFSKQKTAYELRISDWSSDVCSSDLVRLVARRLDVAGPDIDLKGGNAEGRALRRPDFRRKIGEGRKVVSGQRGRQGELATRHLHAVAAVARKTHQLGRASCRERVCPYL